jgi:hypothetical protein
MLLSSFAPTVVEGVANGLTGATSLLSLFVANTAGTPAAGSGEGLLNSGFWHDLWL